ncbi:MAG: hypothetical protein K2H64_06580 [Desulfovibrio sp.]|nr:hypothetical protein [Desulfovibrio sp.]
MKAEDYQAAADLYEQILSQKNPPKEKLQQFYNNLSVCRANLKQPALRLATIDRMLKAVPKLPAAELAEIYARQGDAYRSLELYGPAATAYDKALHALPKGAEKEQRALLLAAAGLALGNLGE